MAANSPVNFSRSTLLGEIVSTLRLKAGAMPQDIRLSPDGTKFYVDDMSNAGLWIVNGDTFEVTGFVATGTGAHGIYPSRDGTLLYVSNGPDGRGHHPSLPCGRGVRLGALL